MKTEGQVIEILGEVRGIGEQSNRNIVTRRRIEGQVLETVKQVSGTVGTSNENRGTSHRNGRTN